MWTVNSEWNERMIVVLESQSEMFDVEIYKCKHTYDTSPCCLFHWEHNSNQYLSDKFQWNQSYPITRDIPLPDSILTVNTQHSTCTLLQGTWENDRAQTSKNEEKQRNTFVWSQNQFHSEVKWSSEWNWNRPFDKTSHWLKTSHDHSKCRLLIVRMCEFKHKNEIRALG